MACTYSFVGPDGEKIRLVGKPALKAYLASGGLQHLLPERAIAAGIRQAMNAPTMSRATGTGGQQIADTFRFASNILSKFKNPPNLEVVEAINDPRVPQAVRDEAAKQKSGGAKGEPEGFYLNGTVYLVNSQLKTPGDVARVLFHESLGHYGLRGLFGEALDPILQGIVDRRKNDVIAKAKSYGLDVSKPEDMLTAAEEVLAEMAQTRPEIGFVQRAIAAIRTWLRNNVPGFADLELSDAEIIRDYILPARAFVQSGAQAGRDMARPAMSRAAAQTDTPAFKRWFGDSKVVDEQGNPLVVYHGTMYDFAVFDLDRSVEGGFFFSVSPQHASKFASEILGRNDITPNVMPVYVSIKNPMIVDGTQLPTEHELEDIESLIRSAKKKGHDGVLIKDFRDRNATPQDTYVVFRPEQIKSAIGNNGNFDPNNPDIRFSRAPVNPVENTGLTPPEQGMLRRVQAAVQDNMNRVKEVQARIEKLTGSKMPEVENYYGAEANRPGRIAARLEDVRDKMMKPLIERLVAGGYQMPQLSELLHAQHAQERNEAVERINPDVKDGSGMTTEKANQILAKYRDERELLKIAEQARQIARATLDLKLAYGLIDDETYSTLTDRYANYVPLKGDGEYGPKIKRAMGHGERDEFILENIARDYDQAVVAGEKNLARQSLAAMILENPDPELWTVGVPPKGRYVAGKIYSVQRNGKQEATFTSMAQVTAFLEAKGAQASQYEVMDSNGERVQSFVKPLQENEVPV